MQIRTLLNQIIDLLLPHVEDPEQREALFAAALVEHRELRAQIDYRGNARTFAQRVVSELMLLEIDANRTAIVEVLDQLKYQVGEDQRGRIESIIHDVVSLVKQRRAVQQDIHADPNFEPTQSDNVPDKAEDKTAPTGDNTLLIRMVGAVILVVSVAWMVRTPGFEPLVGILTALLTLASTLGHDGGWSRWLKWGGASQTARDKLWARIWEYNIEGFLYPTLRDVKVFNLGLFTRTEAVLRHRTLGNFDIEDGNILNAYKVLEGRMLILGHPGIGKTVMLMQLLEVLLKETKGQTQRSLPIVFNLASWAVNQKPIASWVVDELVISYDVPRHKALRWVKDQSLILLLDGLDEVRLDARQACVEALNDFRALHTVTPMVVCSRINDYEEIPERLDLKGAVQIEPLSHEAIEAYLGEDERLAGLRRLVAEDAVVRQMVVAPFLLNTMVYTYADKPIEALRGYHTAEERREHLFDQYIHRRLQDNPSEWTYAEVRDALKWLASKMVAQVQTVFREEDVEPNWLTPSGQANYRSFLGVTSILESLLLYSAFIAALLTPQLLRELIGFFFLLSLWGYYLMFEMGITEITFFFLAISVIPFAWILALALMNAIFPAHILDTYQLRIGNGTLFPSVTKPLQRWYARRLVRSHSPMQTPMHKFLEAMRGRIIMRRFGNGYIFVHRTLLETLAGRDDIEALIENLSNPLLQREIGQQLAQIGQPAFEPMIVALSHPDPEVRIGSAEALRQFDEAVTPSLIQVMTSDKPVVRENAARALSAHQGAEVLQALMRSCQDDHQAVRDAAAKALFPYGRWELQAVDDIPDLDHVLTHFDTVVRSVTARLLGQIETAEAVAYLMRLADDSIGDVRRVAVEKLGQIPIAEAYEALLQLSEHPLPDVRAEAVRGLSNFDISPSLEVIHRALADADARVGLAAAGVIGTKPTAESLVPLTDALEDANTRMKIVIVRSLGAIQDATATPHILPLLFDRDTFLNRAAALALAEIGDQRAVPALVNVLRRSRYKGKYLFEEAHTSARAAMIYALGRLGDRVAVPVLRLYLRHPREYLREESAIALGRIADPETARTLRHRAMWDSRWNVRWEAAKALRLVMEAMDEVEPIIWASFSLRDYIRAAAAHALSGRQEASAKRTLWRLLKDDSEFVRGAALHSASATDRRTIRIISRILRSKAEREESLRWEAAYALADGAIPQSINVLVDALASRDKIVSTAGLAAVGYYLTGARGESADESGADGSEDSEDNWRKTEVKWLIQARDVVIRERILETAARSPQEERHLLFELFLDDPESHLRERAAEYLN